MLLRGRVGKGVRRTDGEWATEATAAQPLALPFCPPVNSKYAAYKERTCSFLAAGGNKKKSTDLGSFDGKQMYCFGLTFRLDAKLLLQQLVCLGISRGHLAVSFFSTLLHAGSF